MTPPGELPPQAPEGGLMRRLLGRLYVTGVFWYRLHRWGVNVLPRWAVAFFIALFTTFFFVALRRIRKAIAHNLEAVLGPSGWWERQRRIYLTMWNLAWCLSERYERFSGRRHPVASVAGEVFWRRLLASPEGFVLVTAHIGNWETALLDPAATDARSIHIVREEEVDPRAQSFIRELVQGESGERIKVHFVRQDDARLASELLVGLRGGDVVAVQGDRPRSGGRTMTARVFDRELELPVGPAALARTAGVEMVPVFCFRRGRLNTEVVVREPIRVATSRDRGRDLAEAVQRVASEVQWAIRQRPFQWFCFRDLWGKTPVPPEAGRRRRWAPSPRTRSAVLALAMLSTLGLSCAVLQRPVAPMRVREYRPAEAGPSDSLAELLPEKQVLELPGGHRWPVWLEPLEELSERGALTTG